MSLPLLQVASLRLFAGVLGLQSKSLETTPVPAADEPPVPPQRTVGGKARDRSVAAATEAAAAAAQAAARRGTREAVVSLPASITWVTPNSIALVTETGRSLTVAMKSVVG